MNKNAMKNNKEKELKDSNSKNTLPKRRKNLISQFPIIDLKYKKFSKK